MSYLRKKLGHSFASKDPTSSINMVFFFLIFIRRLKIEKKENKVTQLELECLNFPTEDFLPLCCVAPIEKLLWQIHVRKEHRSCFFLFVMHPHNFHSIES